MKSSKLPEDQRIARRAAIMAKREFTNRQERPFMGYASTKYPHSSTRQNARYARQLAAGQLKFV